MKTQHDLPTVAKPAVIGAGLLALDLVVSNEADHPVREWAGGTCGNVLLSLSFLGWRSAPVARLQTGTAADRIYNDLRRWDVSTEFVTVDDDGSTPVIVQKIGRTAAGEPYHTFSWRCLNCGSRFPRHKPVLASTALEVIGGAGSPQVFFFDRLSRGILEMAETFSRRGAAIVFEPSAIGNPILFREAWKLAHIVKYSHERLDDLPADLESKRGFHIQIETLGRDGLRFRSRLPRCKKKAWQRSAAIQAEDVKDTAGAGDWCTAGIVHKLLQAGSVGLASSGDEAVRDAVRYGQALAAWNCGYEGARGGMYELGKEAFERRIQRILVGGGGRDAEASKATVPPESSACFCPACQTDVAPKGRRRQRRISVSP